MRLRTSVDAHSRGEHVGAFACTGNLVVGELSPVRTVAAAIKPEVGDDKWGPFVSDSAFKWNFSIFRFE